MQHQSQNWEDLDRSERLLVVLRLIEKESSKIGTAEKKSKKRDLCHLGQHPQAMYWLLRDNVYSSPIEPNKYADCTRRTEKSGNITRKKLQDTLVNEKVESQFGALNSKIPFLTSKGRARANDLLSSVQETLTLPPDWFLYLCLDGAIKPSHESSKNYPLPVVIHDLKPSITGMHHGVWSQIETNKSIRTGFPHHVVMNYSHHQIIRLLREERGIHLLQGGAGSGKTSMVNCAADYWPNPHLVDSSTFHLQLTVSSQDIGQFIQDKIRPPDDHQEQVEWFKDREKIEIPYPASAEEEDWERFERERQEKNRENMSNLITEYVFSKYAQRLPTTTPKGTLLELLRNDKPRIILIIDGLDEVSLNYRNLILYELNQWSLINPAHSILISSRPMATGNQYLSNLETVVELRDLSEDWPMKVMPHELKPEKDLSVETWPHGLARTPLTWMLIRKTQDKTSENADEYEILDQYLDDSMEFALNIRKPPIPKREIWMHLRRAALHHSERKLTEICEIFLLDGENLEQVKQNLGHSCDWARRFMQIMQETHGWRLRGFEQTFVDEGSLKFTHRRVQEYLASLSFSTEKEFELWISQSVIQNPEWCWPIIRDACHRFECKEKIIDRVQHFDEDILGHCSGLIAYLNQQNQHCLPMAIPVPVQHNFTNGVIHRENSTRESINQSRRFDFANRGDYVWDHGQALFGTPQDVSQDAKERAEEMLRALREHEVEEGYVLDWKGTFGFDKSICQCMANSLLEPENQVWFTQHGSNQERIQPFLEYLLSMFWEAKKPENYTTEAWHAMYDEVRQLSLEGTFESNDLLTEIYMSKNHVQPPFKHPASQLMSFFSDNVSMAWAIELCWMFDIPVTGDRFNAWVRSLPNADLSEPYHGWINSVLTWIRTGMTFGQSRYKTRHPRLREQRIYSSNPEMAPTTAAEVIGILDNDDLPLFQKIKLSVSSQQWELKEILEAAHEHGKMGLLRDYLSTPPLMHVPKKILEQTHDELKELGGEQDPRLTELLNNHTEKNNFLNHWCHAPYESGEVPLLREYPWFEELWG